MLKKVITYTDFDDNVQTETFYFNLTKTELLKLQASVEGGLIEHLKKILEDQDGGDMLMFIEEFLGSAYGQRSEDAKRFVKSPILAEEFLQSAAYIALMDEFLAEPAKIMNFIQALIPKDLNEKLEQAGGAEKILADSGIQTPQIAFNPPAAKDPSQLSVEELTALIEARKQQG